jgi:hypothetical protein
MTTIDTKTWTRIRGNYVDNLCCIH